MKGETLIVALIAIALAFWVGTLFAKRSVYQQQEQTQPTVVVEESPPVPPYWTMYGLPTYWPSYLSPYWYYDMPWYGPINSPWGGSNTWVGGRDRYRPDHGPGYRGVATGGFGGGGHSSGGGAGGGHGGGGGGGHH